jgi:hypothetical protein
MNDIAVEFTPRPDRPGLLDAKMLGTNAGGYGLLGKVYFGFLTVALTAKKLEIAFSVFAAIYQRDDMIVFRGQLAGDWTLAILASLVRQKKDTDLHARRDGAVIGFTDPKVSDCAAHATGSRS